MSIEKSQQISAVVQSAVYEITRAPVLEKKYFNLPGFGDICSHTCESPDW